MLIFDRILLVVLALGISALVLSPRGIEAQNSRAGHDCTLLGDAYVELPGVLIDPVAVHKVKVDTSGLSVDCSHG